MWMHPVAIACGNTFVLKPSERDPGVEPAWPSSGARRGCPTACSTSSTATRSLSTRCSSTRTSRRSRSSARRLSPGRATHGDENGKRVQALGGAKNHAVVLPDADLDFAAGHITAAGYGSAGQRCMAVSAVVAVGEVADGLVERLADLAVAVRVGPGTAASDMGPVVTAAARDRISTLIARRRGRRRTRHRRARTGGRRATASSSARRWSTASHRHAHLHRGGLRSGARGPARRDRRGGARDRSTATPTERRGDLHLQRRPREFVHRGSRSAWWA